MIPFFKPKKKCTIQRIVSKHHVISKEETKKFATDIKSDFMPVQMTDAHRLSHLAKKENCAFVYNTNVFKAFYEEGKDISNHQILKEIAEQSGMNFEMVSEVLSSDQYMAQVQSNRENAIVKGIFELPHLRIDGKIQMNGFHNVKALLQQLIRASVQYTKSDHCEEENCDRKKTQ